MKFNPISCPECGELAKGTLETLPGMARLYIYPDTGEAEYEGATDIWWDGQKSDLDSEGRYLLTCANGHEWPAEMQ
jgi:hypothetical protein